MWGNLVNAGAIIVGSILGTLFNRSLPERYQAIIFQAMGLFIIALGVSMSLKMEHVLISVFSLLVGGLLGELLQLDKQIEKLGSWLKVNLKFKSEKFTEGFVTASLVYCIGAMAVLGAIEEGNGKYPTILLTKSVMDGFSAIAFAAALGIGVMFSSLPVFIYQGIIVLTTILFRESLSPAMVNELTAVGGILLIGLGINILNIKPIKVVNLLPSLLLVVAFMYFFG